MESAYIQLHEKGYAHSVEVWNGDDLVGGLYGVSIGKVFYGESMFALESNASKFGFISLVQSLKEKGFEMIDSQDYTVHLESLGAIEIPRDKFEYIITIDQQKEGKVGSWTKWLS
jgi:leucyl/phenylalanyl-tRNA--protein transferase